MKKADNYLDYVFRWASDLEWDEAPADDSSQESLVTLHIRHQGFSHKIAAKFFGKPQVTHVHLEPMGSFIWKQIDGRKSVYEIGQLLHEAFGEEAEPLYERLSMYMKQLERNGFIVR